MSRQPSLTAACLAAALASAALACQGAHAQQTVLTVYTALEPETIKFYRAAFEKAHPDIETRWERESTGVITSRLLAEAANPKADVVVGLAASTLALLAQDGMLMAYEPKGFSQLNPAYADSARPPAWVGNDVYGATICFNTAEAAKLNLPKPSSWKDLANPVYKGKIVMPHPGSSGTGYLDVSAWVQMWGEKEAWKFMDALHENVAYYTHSGSKPCKLAGTGEVPIGISFDFRAGLEIRSGKPVAAVFPSEGLGWDIEANGIMKKAKNPDAARKLVDWMASKEANAIHGNFFTIVAYPGQAKKMEGIPDNYESLLMKKNDFNWAAKNRDRLIKEWNKRYGAKAEAKS
ncbi:putative 2-aminoethylphosphonate ABC transporter substrate-binding protein [Noviherbaspirillum galbum]|uniref:Putative 2-aminoethylphosphonate ABC transporter substrate-binding protein n=1 Tax=Noviherbaspirillum galbum TaxID=2709383 RepID=A0A6B3SKV1_9BURK|nr:putative 2-aminoethylphosphonate ABC transporter substrate-binding protein [Noviherbaspirillum galbum]NEX61423.1 putative 2-aminoethylphosphonate ABC transporter substrate-binding protein [Noviherbaspirillum galbum]